MSISCFNSGSRLPSATVLIIIPKPFGFNLVTSCLSLARSLSDLIFVLTLTFSEKGIITRKRPAKVISQVSRGPFVEIGSLTICTRTSSPFLTVFCIFPSFSVAGCLGNLCKGNTFLSLPAYKEMKCSYCRYLTPRSR